MKCFIDDYQYSVFVQNNLGPSDIASGFQMRSNIVFAKCYQNGGIL